ncbi:hypothetical protein IQ236_14185 [Planktothrix mougeotii LEGE 06226]|uniref:Uncharacterized protein n=2 Tax=Planktothrix mougeotii TaxID=54306 RepID=A0ABR9UD55_9CYAN|nr:hypothetical protein [Planktothrix mougeotii LEGE 06226]
MTLYGTPSQAGFGSAVFDEAIEPGTDLESVAVRVYKHFVGQLWERYGETAWMSPWKRVYVRPVGIEPNIVAELRAIANSTAANHVPILLMEDTEDQDKAQQALAAVFDDPQVKDLSVYAIGDGAALSGLLVAGNRPNAITILISLID